MTVMGGRTVVSSEIGEVQLLSEGLGCLIPTVTVSKCPDFSEDLGQSRLLICS